MAVRKSVGVDVQADDIAYARRQDRYNCAIVRAIQRSIPEAKHVVADKETIRFTIENSETDIMRYVFPTPREAVEHIIQPLDTGGEVEPYYFTLRNAIEAYTPQRRTPKERWQHRLEERDRWRQKRVRLPQQPGHHNHTTNRFVIEPTAPEEASQ